MECNNDNFIRFNINEIKDYLFMKILDNNYNDAEYGLYLDIKQYGKQAFKINKNIHKKVLKNMNKEYNGEF